MHGGAFKATQGTQSIAQAEKRERNRRVCHALWETSEERLKELDLFILAKRSLKDNLIAVEAELQRWHNRALLYLWQSI